MKRLRALLALGLLASAITGCATMSARLGRDPAPVAQLETVRRLTCEGNEAALAAYFASLGTPEWRRVEMSSDARQYKAEGKCLCVAGCKQ